MRLFELFDMGDDGEGDMVSSLRADAIDMLMPLAAQGVHYVTVQAVIDKLRDHGTGINVDRALVMTVLDPNEVKLITKIEGDRVYFKLPEKDDRKVDDDQKQKDANRTKDKAQDQAKKAVKKDSNPLA